MRCLRCHLCYCWARSPSNYTSPQSCLSAALRRAATDSSWKVILLLRKKKKTLFHSCVKTTAHIFPRIRSASRKSGFQLCSPILTATNGSVLEESWFLQWWKQLPWPPWRERCKQWGPFYRWAHSAAVLRRRRNRRQVFVKKGSDMRARLVGKCQFASVCWVCRTAARMALSDPNMTSCTNIKPSCSSSGLNEQ